jgi:CubicO group peptidase (beta-lactamase class C family)
MKQVSIIVAAVFMLMRCSFAQTDSSLHDDYAVVMKLLKENKVPAVGIGIIREGKLREIKVYGELKKGSPAPYNAIFNVASLTKPVVAMLTLKLTSTNSWNLDEPLAKYWTDRDVMNDPRSKKLTTRHVLSHQTGFVNWRWLHPTKKLTFDFEPGTKFQYSGEGLEYLKKALENKFKKSIIELADSLVFKPLAMVDTRFVWNESMDETRFAAWHDTAGVNSHNTFRRTDASAADDLLTTIEDYGKFCVAVLNGFGISEDLWNEMVKPQSTIKKNDFMGLGWEILKGLPNDEYVLVHSGSDQGVRTLAIMLPVTKEGLIIMTNGDNGMKLYFPLIAQSLTRGKELVIMASE